ncbi:MAG: hypothetical protein ACRDM0_26330 [Thermoleophilaceae bacterium]
MSSVGNIGIGPFWACLSVIPTAYRWFLPDHVMNTMTDAARGLLLLQA